MVEVSCVWGKRFKTHSHCRQVVEALGMGLRRRRAPSCSLSMCDQIKSPTQKPKHLVAHTTLRGTALHCNTFLSFLSKKSTSFRLSELAVILRRSLPHGVVQVHCQHAFCVVLLCQSPLRPHAGGFSGFSTSAAFLVLTFAGSVDPRIRVGQIVPTTPEVDCSAVVSLHPRVNMAKSTQRFSHHAVAYVANVHCENIPRLTVELAHIQAWLPCNVSREFSIWCFMAQYVLWKATGNLNCHRASHVPGHDRVVFFLRFFAAELPKGIRHIFIGDTPKMFPLPVTV